MVFCLMDKLLPSETILEPGLNIFAKPNIIELRNLHRVGILKDRQRANMGQYYYPILLLPAEIRVEQKKSCKVMRTMHFAIDKSG